MASKRRSFSHGTKYAQNKMRMCAHLQAGADELDDVAIVAGAQDEDLAPEGLRVP